MKISKGDKTMDFTTIILEKKEGIAKIILNRPEALNAVNKTMVEELYAAAEDIEEDEAIKVVVISGKGRAFSAGADLKYTKGALEDPHQMAEFLRLWHKAYNAIENLSKPVIAAINGFALAGGLELVEACDIAIASEEARLGDQHANFGLMPGGGGTQRLPRLVGIRKAKELLFSGDWVSPQEAERIGLVNRVVPAEKLEEAVDEMAIKLAEKSPLATKAMKAAVNRGMQTDLATALELEIGAILHHFTSDDVIEGINAFEEKRKPVFKGK